MTTEDVPGLGDPVIRRLQQAFAHEEPTTELAAIIRRAARYQAGEPSDAQTTPAPLLDLTAADLHAARRREPAAVTRVYTAYAPTLFHYFMAAVGDRRMAEDLAGTTFVSAMEALPRFRGPVEALSDWLFQIARHDLYDHRRKQHRPRTEPLEEDLDESAALKALSSREREILGLLVNGWSNRRIAEESSLSLNTVRTCVQSILVKLGVHSKLEAVSFALEHGLSPAGEGPEELAYGRLESAQVLAAVRELAPDQREVLLLRMAGGLTVSEVAEILGKSTGAVKALQHRGLASLGRALGWRDPDQGSIHPPTSASPSGNPSPGR